MVEFMDYTPSQHGKYYWSMLEEGGTTHVYRCHRRSLWRHTCTQTQGTVKNKETGGEASVGPGSLYQTSEHSQEPSWPTGNSSKDLYTELYPGTYSVSVGSSALTKKTHAVAADLGQGVDLVFSV